MAVLLLLVASFVHGGPKSKSNSVNKPSNNSSKELNAVQVDLVESNEPAGKDQDQETSDSVTATAKSVKVSISRPDLTTSASGAIPIGAAAAASVSKGDLKSANSFGLGYYFPFVTPTFGKHL